MNSIPEPAPSKEKKGELWIERAMPGDFLAIADLDRRAWPENVNGDSIPDGEHVWRIWCEHAWTWVARAQEKRVVGALVAFPCVDGSSCVHKVMVAESWRGRGIGSLLFQPLFEVLDTSGTDCFLTVDPSNESAVRLYRNWGFTRDRFVKGYYRSHEDRLVLTRPGRVV